MFEPVAKVSLMLLTTQIVSSFIAQNSLPPDQLPKLIHQVYQTLATVGGTPPEADTLQPAVPIRKSVHRDYLICLEDGKKLKTLKRYLKAVYGMTPDGYRAKWGLPPTYPMVAPSYAEHRSGLAKESGLGRRDRGEVDSAA